jgi:hypothetical protein
MIASSLLKAKRPLAITFGCLPNVDLGILIDPDDGQKSALATIRWPGLPEDGLERLHRFYQGWWYEHVEDSNYLLSFSVVVDAI